MYNNHHYLDISYFYYSYSSYYCYILAFRLNYIIKIYYTFFNQHRFHHFKDLFPISLLFYLFNNWIPNIFQQFLIICSLFLIMNNHSLQYLFDLLILNQIHQFLTLLLSCIPLISQILYTLFRIPISS